MKAHRLCIGRTRRKKERSHGTAEYRLPQRIKTNPFSMFSKRWYRVPYNIIFKPSPTHYNDVLQCLPGVEKNYIVIDLMFLNIKLVGTQSFTVSHRRIQICLFPTYRNLRGILSLPAHQQFVQEFRFLIRSLQVS